MIVKFNSNPLIKNHMQKVIVEYLSCCSFKNPAFVSNNLATQRLQFNDKKLSIGILC